MAIEIPNLLCAAAAISPNALPDDPLTSNNGFEAYDPATDGSDPDLTVGGFTQVATGDFIMKLQEGGDPLELAPFFTAVNEGNIITGSMIPYGVPAPGTYPDGKSLQVGAVDHSNTPVDPAFFVAVFRYATGPNILSLIP